MDSIKRAIANLPPPWTYPSPPPRFDLVGFNQGQPVLKTVGGGPFTGAEFVTNGSIQAGPVFTQFVGNRIEIGGVPRVVPFPETSAAIDAVDLYFLVDQSEGLIPSYQLSQKRALKEFLTRLEIEGRNKVRALGLTTIRVGMGVFGLGFEHKVSLGGRYDRLQAELTPLTTTFPEGVSWAGGTFNNVVTVPNYIPGGVPLTRAYQYGVTVFKPLDAMLSAATDSTIGWRSQSLKVIVFSGALSELIFRQSTATIVALKQTLDDRGIKVLFLSYAAPAIGLFPNYDRPETLGEESIAPAINWWQYEAFYLGAPWVRFPLPVIPSYVGFPAIYAAAIVALDRQFYQGIGRLLDQVKLRKKWSLQDFKKELAKIWTTYNLNGSPPI